MRNANNTKKGNKTVNINGVKSKVSFTKTLISHELVYSNEENREEKNFGVIYEYATVYSYTTNGMSKEVLKKSGLRSTRKGDYIFAEYTENGLSFGDNEKKILESILNN
tara:strand:+ start:36 stop:362 length:327 start_codon:yes stop_codon:yes gene_type:complete